MNNNVQKIYVDVDEEITTVIDRLKQSSHMSVEIIVPQHALLLQSVVNLKLLLQESKKYGKKILLVTNDVDGISFAERAGISVRYFAEGEEIESNKVIELNSNNGESINQSQHVRAKSNSSHQQQSQQFQQSPIVDHVSEMNMGYHEQSRQRNRMIEMNDVPQKNMSNTINSVTKNNNIVQHNNGRPFEATVAQSLNINHIQHENNNNVGFDEYEKTLKNSVIQNTPRQQSDFQNLAVENNRKIASKKKKSKNIKKRQENVAMSGTSKFAVKGFIFGASIVLVVVIMVIILPKTKLQIEPKQINIDETMEMTAKADQNMTDSDRRMIPARVIERDVTFTKTFNATGTGDVNAQKAQGTIKILNEFSSEPQPLVATTRFLAENGTLFRLVKATTVPGMNGNEPGSVEALVAADEPGESGNITPTKFSIPGFSSGPKKEKIYAVSEKSMTGGGMGGKGVSLVTEDDIKIAEKEMNDELGAYVKDQINALLRPEDEVLLDENVRYEVLRSEPNVSEGTMVDQFMYEIVSSVESVVFSQKDVMNVMNDNLIEKYSQYDEDKVDIDIEYKGVVPNFEDDSLKLNAVALTNVVATVDIAAFRGDVRGKKHDKLLNIIESEYKDEIEKIILESVVPGFPVFISDHISKFDFMTDISVK